MKYILQIQNYDSNKMYVDEVQKKFALDTYKYCSDFYNNDVENFKDEFLTNNVPTLLLQRKTDFYNFAKALKEDGYEEIKAIPYTQENEVEDIEM